MSIYNIKYVDRSYRFNKIDPARQIVNRPMPIIYLQEIYA